MAPSFAPGILLLHALNQASVRHKELAQEYGKRALSKDQNLNREFGEPKIDLQIWRASQIIFGDISESEFERLTLNNHDKIAGLKKVPHFESLLGAIAKQLSVPAEDVTHLESKTEIEMWREKVTLAELNSALMQLGRGLERKEVAYRYFSNLFAFHVMRAIEDQYFETSNEKIAQAFQLLFMPIQTIPRRPCRTKGWTIIFSIDTKNG